MLSNSILGVLWKTVVTSVVSLMLITGIINDNNIKLTIPSTKHTVVQNIAKVSIVQNLSTTTTKIFPSSNNAINPKTLQYPTKTQKNQNPNNHIKKVSHSSAIKLADQKNILLPPIDTTSQKNIAGPTVSAPKPSISEVNQITRDAIVNIMCTSQISGPLKPMTASGVIISKNGVILTNAHVAQYFLLKDYPIKDSIQCIARIGSPAKNSYILEPLYISKKWIEANRANLKQESPTGTGENDFAFLLITKNTDNSPLPPEFPFVEPSEKEENPITVYPNENYILAGYPAGFLGGAIIQRELYLSTSVTTIKDVYTFRDNNTIDVMALGGSVVAQKGSSGGAVVRQTDRKLVGIITTTSDSDTTAGRDLNAITTSHISRSLNQETGLSIKDFLSGDLRAKTNDFFNNQSLYLKTLLITELNGN